MSAIGTIPASYQHIQIGDRIFNGVHTIPFHVWTAVVVAMVIAKMQKRRTRRQLGQLTAEQLRDVGITRAEADREVRKSFPGYQRFH